MRRGGVPTGTEAFASSPCAIERLEPRTLCAGDAASESSPPLRVTEVYVSGSAWTPQFLEHLERRGMGLSPFGLRVYSWDSTPAPPVLPWVNLDRVTIRFNSTNMGVDPQDLTVRGARRPVYGFAGFEYSEDPGVRGTATWTLAPDASFRMWGDRLRLELNGDPPDGVNLSSSPGFFLDGDADGRPGGDFRLEFHVSPGDVITDGTVLPSDLLVVRRHIFRSTTEPGSFYQYHHLINIDGTGRIDLRDFVEVRRRCILRPVSRQFQFAERATTGRLTGLFGDRRITTSVTLAALLI